MIFEKTYPSSKAINLLIYRILSNDLGHINYHFHTIIFDNNESFEDIIKRIIKKIVVISDVKTKQ